VPPAHPLLIMARAFASAPFRGSTSCCRNSASRVLAPEPRWRPLPKLVVYDNGPEYTERLLDA